jgi:hypothetical protein
MFSVCLVSGKVMGNEEALPYIDASGTTYSWPLLSSINYHLEIGRMPQVLPIWYFVSCFAPLDYTVK